MTANAEIILEQFPDSLLVPEAAVFYDAQKQSCVDVADPGSKIVRRSACRCRSASATAPGSRCSAASRLAYSVVLPG